MGVLLTPLLNPNVRGLSELGGKRVVIDGCNLLFRYLSKIKKNEEILYNEQGEPISHLIGFFYFSINLTEYRIRPIFVFDGYPPNEKREKSPEKIDRLIKMWKYYNDRVTSGNASNRILFQKDGLFLYDKIISDLQAFIKMLGLPVVRGLGEGEAQGARLVREKKAYGMISEDQDSLLFGCHRIFRRVQLKQGICYSLNLKDFLGDLGITRGQLIDIAILTGTDYNRGIRGIGPKKALKLIKKFGQIEKIPDIDLPTNLTRLRSLFLEPPTIEITPLFRSPNSDQIKYYLINKGLSRERVEKGVRRLKTAFRQINFKQSNLMEYSS